MIWIEHLPILKWQNLYPKAKYILTIDKQRILSIDDILMRWNILGNYKCGKNSAAFVTQIKLIRNISGNTFNISVIHNCRWHKIGHLRVKEMHFIMSIGRLPLLDTAIKGVNKIFYLYVKQRMICLKHTPILKMYTYIQTPEIYWQPGMSGISAMVIGTNIISIIWVFIQLIRNTLFPPMRST